MTQSLPTRLTARGAEHANFRAPFFQMVKRIILPRQARDKCGESSRRGLFRQARGDGQRPDAVEAAAVLRVQVREERQTEVSAADTRSESRARLSHYCKRVCLGRKLVPH